MTPIWPFRSHHNLNLNDRFWQDLTSCWPINYESSFYLSIESQVFYKDDLIERSLGYPIFWILQKQGPCSGPRTRLNLHQGPRTSSLTGGPKTISIICESQTATYISALFFIETDTFLMTCRLPPRFHGLWTDIVFFMWQYNGSYVSI